MAKEYGIKFGSGALSLTSGLAPTFIHFVRLDTGGTVAPPGITQIINGIGIYKFSYTPSFPIYFEIDGATTVLGSDRYIHGMLDRIDQVDQDVAGISAMVSGFGASLVGTSGYLLGISAFLAAQGNTLLGTSGILLPLVGISGQVADISARIGTTASSFGSTSVDPGTLFGYMKRIQEFNEGAQVYVKSSGLWSLFSRSSSTLLSSKTVAETATEVTRS